MYNYFLCITIIFTSFLLRSADHEPIKKDSEISYKNYSGPVLWYGKDFSNKAIKRLGLHGLSDHLVLVRGYSFKGVTFENITFTSVSFSENDFSEAVFGENVEFKNVVFEKNFFRNTNHITINGEQESITEEHLSSWVIAKNNTFINSLFDQIKYTVKRFRKIEGGQEKLADIISKSGSMEIQNCSFRNSDFSELKCKKIIFYQCDFSGAKFLDINFENVWFIECYFHGTQIYDPVSNGYVAFDENVLNTISIGENNYFPSSGQQERAWFLWRVNKSISGMMEEIERSSLRHI